MMRRTRNGQGVTRGREGFSIVELLIVVTVIVILAAIIIGAGSRIFGAQRERVTRSVLSSLDRALEEYIAVEGGIPPFPSTQQGIDDLYKDVPGDPSDVDPRYPEFTNQLANPYGGSLEYPAFPDASVFLNQARGIDSVEKIIEAIPEQFLVQTLEDPTSLPSDDVERAKEQPSIVDAWGSPEWRGAPIRGVQQFILYVHPSNRLAQDIYGKCVNRRPYFVSAGPDKLYGHPGELAAIEATYSGVDPGAADEDFLRLAREDNIYSYEVDTEFDTPDDVISALSM